MTNSIHPTAIVSDNASLGNNNQIGPFVVIEEGVELGEGNVIHSGAVLRSGTRLGNGNQVHEHAVLGGAPQDLGFDPATATYLELGNDNVIREAVVIHRASKADQATRLGNNNYLMNGVLHDHRRGSGPGPWLEPGGAQTSRFQGGRSAGAEKCLPDPVPLGGESGGIACPVTGQW